MNGYLPWVAFGAGVAALLAFDLGVVNRGEKAIGVRRALLWSLFWIALAFGFAGLVWAWLGAQPAREFVAGYLIEKSLSVDNIFIFLLVFSALGIRAVHQHKVLFWGILGAIVMRLAFILGGLALLERFHWMVYVFGALLLATAARMWRAEGASIDLGRNPVIKLAERRLPLDCSYTGHSFVIRRDGRRMFTSLALALLVIESADVVFAVDSVPAVLAISRDPFIVFTSNVFAILGLRSLYFALAGCIERFSYLHYGLSLVLAFVGVKMLLADVLHIPTGIALGFVALVVAGSVVVSLVRSRSQCRVGAGSVPGSPDALEPED